MLYSVTMEENDQDPISPAGQNPDREKALDAIRETSAAFQEAIEHEKSLSESFWNGMNSEEQLWAFCAVMRRLHKGEIEDGRSYRGVLYSTFGWGPEAYAPAQCSGYLDIHNAIHTSSELETIVQNTIKELGIEADPERIHEIIFKRLYY